MTRNNFTEDTLSEQPALQQLQGMGYTILSGSQLDPQETDECERSSRREVVLANRLKRKLAELNPDAAEETLDKAVRFITNPQGAGLLEENQTLHRGLVASRSFEQDTPEGRRFQTIRFFDFENLENNEFLAVNQFWVKGPKLQDRPDIVIFVNGIPVAVMECKNPVARDTGVADAIDQLIRYQREIPALFRTNQLLIGANVFGARYGAVGARPEDFHEWKANPEEKLPVLKDHPAVKELLAQGLLDAKDLPTLPAAQDLLIACLLNRRNLIDLIRNFIAFEVNDRGQITKKICRYQQWVATRKIVRRVLDESDKQGIIWHWQGSGKSLTMLFTALALKREERRLKNPCIVIVTDRVDLDEQITNTFRNCGFPNPERAETSQDLYRMLAGPIGRTIMTTVHKFRRTLEKPLSTATNIIVLTDEAHRTQYGEYAFNLRKALPNAAFFAFTGTPLNKKDRNTYRHFSPPRENYLDRYSIQQAEEDNATRPIKYVGRLANLHVVGNSLDSMLRDLFPEKSKEDLAVLKQRYSAPDILAAAPRRIERIAMDILAHYAQYVRPNGLKAMIVAASRGAAVEYKNALDKLAEPEASKVVMTLDERNDPEDWRQKFALTIEQERDIKQQFKDPKSPLTFLIVCDKLLTGFDAPILQVMYLDQTLREHTLLQAVARTNRVYPGKGYGIIVDYAGVGAQLAEAVSLFSAEDLQGMFRTDDVERELNKLKICHDEAMALFAGVPREGGNARELLQQCVLILQDDKARKAFDRIFLEYSRSMDFLLPDLRVDPFMKDFKFLSMVRQGAINLTRDDTLAKDDLSPKIQALIHAHIASEGVDELLAPITITAPDFKEKLEAKGNAKAKAVHVEYALQDTITKHVAEDRAFYGSLQQQLEEIIEARKQARIDDARALQGYLDLKEQVDTKETKARELGLENAREFAIFGLLSEMKRECSLKDPARIAAAAKEIKSIIDSHMVAEWAEREDVLRIIRRDLKRYLRAMECDEEHIPEMVREVMEMAMQWEQ